MAEPILNASRVVTGVGQGVAAGVAQHGAGTAFTVRANEWRAPRSIPPAPPRA
jgi:putative effector of murein hydrolase